MFDTILAKSDRIIYQPGGTNSGITVTTWAQVQQFFAFRTGALIAYIDDSITSPAPVPTASGVTQCNGRVEFRSARAETAAVLLIQAGATLDNVWAFTNVEARCATTTATPAITFTESLASIGQLILKEFGFISNDASATEPVIVLQAGQTLQLSLNEGDLILNAPTVPLISVPATATLAIFAVDGSEIAESFASGAGDVFLDYDNSTASQFFTPGTPPALPGITGTYTATNLDNIWAQKPIDAATFNAPGDAFMVLFNGGTQMWEAVAMSGDATITNAGVVTVTGGGGTLTGNVNGPLGANKFLSLEHIVANADYPVTETSGWIFVEITGLSAARTVTLPAAPTAGMVVNVTSDGTLANFNITINGNGKNIDSAATYVMSAPQNSSTGSIVLQYDGTQWIIAASHTKTLGQILLAGPLTVTIPQNFPRVLVFCDTSAGAINVTLPTPLAGVPAQLRFRDRAQSFQTHALTLTPPGSVNINGSNTPIVISAQNAMIDVDTDGTNYFM
jgi:hypothetical protein